MESCDTVCSKNGLSCTETEFANHNHEVDSSQKVITLIKTLGGETLAKSCVSRDYPTVPLFNKESECMYSEKGGRSKPFDCATVAGPPDAMKQRLCFCHKLAGNQII